MLSVIGEVRATLDTIGAEQQACVFVFLMCYPLALGRLLEGRGRRIAAEFAVASALGFMVLTDPWMHAVLLLAVGMGGLGLFIAAVFAVDRLAGRMALPDSAQRSAAALPVSVQPGAAALPARERMPIRVTVSAKP
jgi:hypothetical protein